MPEHRLAIARREADETYQHPTHEEATADFRPYLNRQLERWLNGEALRLCAEKQEGDDHTYKPVGRGA